MSFLAAGSGKLSRALKNVRISWDAASGQWRDIVARHYEEGTLKEIEELSLSTLREMERLADTLSQAKRECQ